MNIRLQKLRPVGLLLITAWFWILPAVGTAGDSEQEARKLYYNAQKSCLAREWDKAIDRLQQLIEQFPESKYHDDALFWIGYNLEKKPDSFADAFSAYERLIKKFPGSSWIDDAVIHQIGLAEKFVKTGNDHYLTFLSDKLKESEPSIRQQAAIALGKLGDKRAIPVLKETEKDEDLGEMATALLNALASGEGARTKQPITETVPEHLGISTVEDKNERVEKNATAKRSSFFESTSLQLYQKMMKVDNNWSKDELLTFGLFYILPPEQFEEFYALNPGYDRMEWQRKFWKRQDPTPTTDENERKDEFERRVNYAWEHYSDSWDFRHINYLKIQYLREGWAKAPWDARGEIYIKYGEPDFRTITGYHTEEWTYHKFNVDFLIKQYLTNIYGNAISPGPMSRNMYRDRMSYVEANFISNPEFRYQHDYKADAVKDFALQIKVQPEGKASAVQITYKMPLKELNITRYNGQQSVQFLEQYVIYDEDLREILRQEKVKTLDAAALSNLKDGKTIEQIITLNTAPGDYLFALRIQDPAAKKLAIFVERFSVKN